MTNGIGTLQEKSLHAAVKDWYASPGDRLEHAVDGYVVDIVRDETTLIEIQTGGFAPLKRKLRELTVDYTVRLVHPIAAMKWIVRVAADGGEGNRTPPFTQARARRAHIRRAGQHSGLDQP